MDVEQLLQKLDFKSDKGSYEGLLALVFQEISDELKEFALSSKKKDEILLTQEELLREYKIARWYNHHGNPDHTLIILGELMISWMIKVRDMRDWLITITPAIEPGEFLTGCQCVQERHWPG